MNRDKDIKIYGKFYGSEERMLKSVGSCADNGTFMTWREDNFVGIRTIVRQGIVPQGHHEFYVGGLDNSSLMNVYLSKIIKEFESGLESVAGKKVNVNLRIWNS